VLALLSPAATTPPPALGASYVEASAVEQLKKNNKCKCVNFCVNFCRLMPWSKSIKFSHLRLCCYIAATTQLLLLLLTRPNIEIDL
jgi:hypothetical protein